MSIRIFVIIHDLDDAAPDWIIGRTTSSLLLSQLYTNFDFIPEPSASQSSDPLPHQSKLPSQGDDFTLPPPRVPDTDDHVLLNDWSAVKLLEEYDPEEMTSHTRPYAFVADYAVRVDLSVDVAAEVARYEKRQQEDEGEWFGKLRDQMQGAEDIKWYIVVCGDEAREVPGLEDESETGYQVPSHISQDTAKEGEQSFQPPILAEGASRNGKAGRGEGLGRLPRGQNEMEDDTSTPRAQAPPQHPKADAQRTSPTVKTKKSMAAGLRKLFGRKPQSRAA